MDLFLTLSRLKFGKNPTNLKDTTTITTIKKTAPLKKEHLDNLFIYPSVLHEISPKYAVIPKY